MKWGGEKRTFNKIPVVGQHRQLCSGRTVPMPELNDAARRCLRYGRWDALNELFAWAILSS